LQQPPFGRRLRRKGRKHNRLGPHHPKFFRLHRHGKNILCLGKNDRQGNTTALGNTSGLGKYDRLGIPPWEIRAAADKPAAVAAAAEKPKPADKPAAAEKAAVAANPQFELLSKVVPGLSPEHFSIVQGTVKRFSQDWETGARNPNRYLREVRSNQPALLDEWENTPPKKRIFVIGSGEDFPKISEWAQSLKSEGNTVFFYKYCRPLCSSKAVGAMAATSGQIMLYRTTSAELSKYVKVEVAQARFREGLDKRVILITTEELFAAKTFQMHVAEMRMPTPSPVK
jgi:hypothetical protein